MYIPLKAMLSASGVVQLLYIKSKWLMGCTLKSHTTPLCALSIVVQRITID